MAPLTLTGRFVELVPLSIDHVDELAAAAAEDRATYGWTIVPDGADAMARSIDALLADAAAGAIVPFAQRRVADGRAVGCTRFLELRWPLGRADPDEVEIGGTWLAASAQRTPINTEAKRLLLAHAFETWGVGRVAIATDERNARSRAAIERLGAHLDGVLRHHRPRMAPGETGLRNTAVYSITDAEWPAVRATLDARLARP